MVLFGGDEIYESGELMGVWWWDLFSTPPGDPDTLSLAGERE